MTLHTRTIETHLDGDKRYACSCGEKGSPAAREDDAIAHHRLHLVWAQPHRWKQGRHGADGACGRCGKPKSNPIHLNARGGG